MVVLLMGALPFTAGNAIAIPVVDSVLGVSQWNSNDAEAGDIFFRRGDYVESAVDGNIDSDILEAFERSELLQDDAYGNNYDVLEDCFDLHAFDLYENVEVLLSWRSQYWDEYRHRDTTPVPEPTSLAMFGTGLLGIYIGRRRIRRRLV